MRIKNAEVVDELCGDMISSMSAIAKLDTEIKKLDFGNVATVRAKQQATDKINNYFKSAIPVDEYAPMSVDSIDLQAIIDSLALELENSLTLDFLHEEVYWAYTRARNSYIQKFNSLIQQIGRSAVTITTLEPNIVHPYRGEIDVVPENTEFTGMLHWALFGNYSINPKYTNHTKYSALVLPKPKKLGAVLISLVDAKGEPIVEMKHA